MMAAIVIEALADRSPTTLRERAYQSFTRHIIARDIRAGQFVSQRELVELTGLPIAAIRELIPRLEAEGLIRTAPQRGMQIASVDINLIRNAFQYRLFLEQAAVATFARDARPGTIERLVVAHNNIITKIQLQLAQGDPSTELISEVQAIDWDLHATIIDSLGNTIISDAYRVNAIKIRLIRQAQTRLNPDLLMPTMQEHLAVIDAIAARDASKAADAMVTHIMSAQDKAMRIA